MKIKRINKAQKLLLRETYRNLLIKYHKDVENVSNLVQNKIEKKPFFLKGS